MAAFLAGFDEDPVAALMAGLAGGAGLVPCEVTAAQALVADLKWIHGRFAVCALGQISGAPAPSIGAIAVPALVEY